MAPPCLQGGKGVALHELLHAVGFGHEHSRPDRDAFISIAWSHVLPGEPPPTLGAPHPWVLGGVTASPPSL